MSDAVAEVADDDDMVVDGAEYETVLVAFPPASVSMPSFAKVRVAVALPFTSVNVALLIAALVALASPRMVVARTEPSKTMREFDSTEAARAGLVAEPDGESFTATSGNADVKGATTLVAGPMLPLVAASGGSCTDNCDSCSG